MQGFVSERELRSGRMWSFHLPLPALGLSVAPLGGTFLAVRHFSWTITPQQMTGLKAHLPNTCWLLSMAVRRVCSNMASRSNVRAFLPARNKDISLPDKNSTIYSWSKETIVCTYQSQRIPSQMQCLHLHSLCLIQEKDKCDPFVSVLHSNTKWCFLAHFRRSLCRLNAAKAQINFVNKSCKWPTWYTSNIISTMTTISCYTFSEQGQLIFDHLSKALYCRISKIVKKA